MPSDLAEYPQSYEVADPQMRLQFVEREIDGRKVRILQQLWTISTMYGRTATAFRTEWRDVPLVTEG